MANYLEKDTEKHVASVIRNLLATVMNQSQITFQRILSSERDTEIECPTSKNAFNFIQNDKIRNRYQLLAFHKGTDLSETALWKTNYFDTEMGKNVDVYIVLFFNTEQCQLASHKYQLAVLEIEQLIAAKTTIANAKHGIARVEQQLSMGSTSDVAEQLVSVRKKYHSIIQQTLINKTCAISETFAMLSLLLDQVINKPFITTISKKAFMKFKSVAKVERISFFNYKKEARQEQSVVVTEIDDVSEMVDESV